jgi:hypothetical protein
MCLASGDLGGRAQPDGWSRAARVQAQDCTHGGSRWPAGEFAWALGIERGRLRHRPPPPPPLDQDQEPDGRIVILRRGAARGRGHRGGVLVCRRRAWPRSAAWTTSRLTRTVTRTGDGRAPPSSRRTRDPRTEVALGATEAALRSSLVRATAPHSFGMFVPWVLSLLAQWRSRLAVVDCS